MRVVNRKTGSEFPLYGDVRAIRGLFNTHLTNIITTQPQIPTIRPYLLCFLIKIPNFGSDYLMKGKHHV